MKTIFTLSLAVIVLFSAMRSLAQESLPKNGRTVYVTIEGSKIDFVEGLKAENFALFDNKVEQKIVYFSDQPEPASAGFLFDVSSSVLRWGKRDLNEAAESLGIGVGHLTGEYFLSGFNRDSALLSDWTNRPEVFQKGIQKLPSLLDSRSTRVTSLHDACLTALKKLDQGKYSKKVLVVFTDGVDSSSKTRLRELVDALVASHTLVYFVTIVNIDESQAHWVAMGPGDPGNISAEFFNSVTKKTGGKVYEAHSEDPTNVERVHVSSGKSELRQAFEKLFLELNSQYTLRYASNEPSRTHSIDVKVTLPKEIKRDSGSTTIRFQKNFEN